MTTKLDGSKGIIYPDNSTQATASYNSFRNRIINGDMRIDQRNSGAAVTLNTAALIYTVDRFGFGWVSGGAVGSAQRISGGISANSLKLIITTGAAPTGNQTYNLQQRIEGFNVSDFLLGTTSAQNIAVSFKVKSSIAGTFSGALQNGAQNRSYPFTYTINTANVAQPVSFVIPGDQAGTWATDNTAGLIVILDLGGAGTARGAAGSWQAGAFFGATNAVNLVATTNATFEISEVQVEPVGTLTAASSTFERLDYGEMLRRCQRYFVRLWNSSVLFQGNVTSGSPYAVTAALPVSMRASPTASNITSSASSGFGAISFVNGTPISITFQATANTTASSAYFWAGADASAEL